MTRLPAPSRAARRAVLTGTAFVLVAASLVLATAGPGSPVRAATDSVTILGEPAQSLDPALQGNIGSAQVTSQLFESLTTVDVNLQVQPALASSWTVGDGGHQVTFHLRPNLEFSDGSALTAQDVVDSWFRVIDPRQASPLASLLDDVTGAADYLAGRTTDRASVGISASGSDVVVKLRNPAQDFPAIVASPTFGVLPSDPSAHPEILQPGTFVGSGGYTLTAESTTELTLTANPHYWAGTPAIRTVHLLLSIAGQSPVQVFQDGKLDYTDISPYDASWIAYDRTLGPDLRTVSARETDYFGFDTSRTPFSDPRVRRAFAQAVDWKRLVELQSATGIVPATSMVPPGIPNRGSTDYSPSYDVAAAQAELAAAGYPGGRGFPTVTLVTQGFIIDGGIIRQLHDNLGIDVAYETSGTSYFDLLASSHPPQFWELSWVADYPGADDFLGLLLGTGESNNYGHWSSSEFDAAVSAAQAATSATAAQAAWNRAQAVVQRDDPVIPVSYSSGWALARPGLLGATENGLGLLRYAGLSWSGQ